jgi:thioredoxin-related protein
MYQSWLSSLARDARVVQSPSARGHGFFGAAFLILVLVPGGSSAQEVSWRADYNTARREAQEKGLPLMLDFGTENCFWCRRLEESTFRDPGILSLLNDRFVSLKVDAGRNTFLTDALRIQSFPTIVLAAPDGKILGTFEGYMEAGRFQDVLQTALANLSTPEWMTRDYQEAAKAISMANYARAATLLKAVLADDKGSAVQLKARQLFSDLEQQAAARLTRARQLEEKNQCLEAADAYGELARIYAGTQAATDGEQALAALTARPEVKTQQRTRRARELLGLAREDYRAKQYLCCLDRCELLAASFGDLAEGAEAMQILTEIKNNPEWMRQACESLSERLGFLYLSLAETWVKRGQPQQAVFWLERVQQTFPGTRQAEAAQTRLAQLQGEPARRTEFKRPLTELSPGSAAKQTLSPTKPGS